MSDERPPQAVVMQLVMGAWASQAVSAITRLGVPDLLERHGPLSAEQLTRLGVDARSELLERALRHARVSGSSGIGDDRSPLIVGASAGR